MTNSPATLAPVAEQAAVHQPGGPSDAGSLPLGHAYRGGGGLCEHVRRSLAGAAIAVCFQPKSAHVGLPPLSDGGPSFAECLRAAVEARTAAEIARRNYLLAKHHDDDIEAVREAKRHAYDRRFRCEAALRNHADAVSCSDCGGDGTIGAADEIPCETCQAFGVLATEMP